MSDRTAKLAWLALGIAFSPVLADLAQTLRADPDARPTLLAPLLVALCWVRGIGREGPSGRDGIALLALGLALELVGILGSSWSIARLGLPIGVLGLARLHGRPALQVAVLAFGVVPVPSTLFAMTTPWLESTWLALACAPLRGLGLDVEPTGPVLRDGGAAFELQGSDGGLLLAVVLAQLGWFTALQRTRDWLRLAATAAGHALLAVGLQPLVVGVAVVLFVAFSARAAAHWLDAGVWVALAAAWIALASRHRPASASPASADSRA